MVEGGQYEECVGSTDSDSGRVGPRRVSQGSEASYGSPPVDPLVVNFEEESDSESIPTSTPIKKRQQKNLRVKTLEEIKLERVQAESAAFYAYNSTPVKPESDTTVASTPTSSWDSEGDSDLRAKILSRKSHRNSKADVDFRVMTLDEIRKRRPHEEGHYSAMEEKMSVAMNSSIDIPGGAVSVKQFKNGFKVENNSATSEDRFQTRQKRFKSDHNFEEDRVVCHDKGTVLFNKKVDAKNNGDTLTEPVTGGHFVIKTLAQIRAEKNSLVENTSSCSVPERSVGSDCLPQELSQKNSETEDGLRSVGDSKDFLVSGSNPDENACFQQTNETKSDGKGTPRRRQLQLKRNNIDTAVHAPKRSKVIRLTSDLLKDSEVTVQVPGSVTSNVCSDPLKTNGTLCLETGGSSCVRLGQPVTNISEDSFKSCSKSVMNSCACDKRSSTFNIAGSDVAKSTDLSSETTTNPVTTSVLHGKHPDMALSEFAGNIIGVTHPSKSPSGERLESKLALATKSVDCVLDDVGENCAMKPLSVLQTQQGNTDIDELLLGDTEDNCVILDAEEDILQDIDDLLND
ncbi:hypothetical protein B7P43_G03557 [Cryptotermes secundus]|nr:hypothetical protein B7P43_G03557 [Cryptotermes secundus]